MLERNLHFLELEESYLFPKIREKATAYSAKHPDQELLRFGIGDVSQPLIPPIVEAIERAARELGTAATFKGYGPEQGYLELRQSLASVQYQDRLTPEEIFVSDGAKCDIARLFTLIHPKARIFLQTPCYPAFADAWTIIRNRTNLHFLPCDAAHATPISLDPLQSGDLLVLVNPNNPTGHLMPLDKLQTLISSCAQKGVLILYDSAYHAYIQDKDYPFSIYEIPGARRCVIEIGSFSKSAGFTGVRLGWTAIPQELLYGASKTALATDFKRLVQTLFNGASYLSQAAGLAALKPESRILLEAQRKKYLTHASGLREALIHQGWQVSGGIHCPFVWAKPPLDAFKSKTPLTSWELFDALLARFGCITTPGSGFGELGEGYIRLSGFATDDHTQKAIRQFKNFH